MRHACLASTNDEALARLRAGDPGGVIVTAERQTRGRGRQGRSWASPVGNLYASLALRDPAPMACAPQLGFVAGVALARTLRTRLACDGRLRLKWPNDVVVAGAKLAGILLEGTSLPDGGVGCVVGFGVNCASHPGDLDYRATDLRAEGAIADPVALLDDLARAFDAELRCWRRGAGFAAIRAAWLEMAAGIGERIIVRTPRVTLTGVFRDLDGAGRLLLETAAGPVPVEAGDVFLSVPVVERATVAGFVGQP